MTAAAALRDLGQRLAQGRTALAARYEQNRRPDPFLIGLRRLVDQLIRSLLQRFPLPEGASLAAIGGYGRGELFPYSDVDLLVLLPEEPDAGATDQLAHLVAALWDLGLRPSHSVRTVENCVQAARSDITIETALLEARYLAGSRRLMQSFTQAMQGHLDAFQFLRAKQAEMRARHARYDNTPYALEPNCKESPGGLRDLQVICWMGRAAGFGQSWRQFAANGLITDREARDLRRAEQALRRLRIELHLLTGRNEDRLLFSHQQALAEREGLTAEPPRRPSERLMQRYYLAAKLVTQLNTLLVASLDERLSPGHASPARTLDSDFVDRDGLLDIHLEDAYQRNPTLLLRTPLRWQEHPELRGLSAHTLRAWWNARTLIDAQFRRNPVHRRLFIDILRQPRGVTEALRTMNDFGILPRYLPVFRGIVGQMQHDLFHIYTVDQHTLKVIGNLEHFRLNEPDAELPHCHRRAQRFEDYWLLYIGALFHDIAKGRGGDHSSLGAIEVRRFGQQHGLRPQDIDLLVFLVDRHLLLSQVAQKQDLSDPDVIQAFVAQVGTQRRLDALYLLTVADIRGTSPRVWSAWKGKLLEDLYRLARQALAVGLAQGTDAVRERQGAALALLNDGAPAEAPPEIAPQALWARFDHAYFLRHTADELAWHALALTGLAATPQASHVAMRATSAGGLQLLVYTPQRDGLFSGLCGWLELHQLDVVDARLHSRADGQSLWQFTVLVAEDGSTPDSAELGALAEMLHQEVLPRPGTSAPRMGRSRRSRVFPVPPSARLAAGPDAQRWQLHIETTDRPGLLRALAQVFEQHGVQLLDARIMTLGERAEDSFLIRAPALSDPATHPAFLAAVSQALVE